MIARARKIPVDEVILDLEDAVRPDEKAHARDLVVASITSGEWLCGTLAVRINGPGTPWCHTDILAIAANPDRATSIVLPKVESRDDIAFATRLLAGVEAEHRVQAVLGIQALIESAAGIESVRAIAAASDRIVSLVLGYADLAASIGRSLAGARQLGFWAPAQHALLMAARAHNVQAIDGPWLGTAVDANFTAAAQLAADMGFDGKWAIHPAQLPYLHQAFSPAPDQVAWAREVLVAFEESSAGAVAVDGAMVDEAVAVSARRILERAEVDA